MDNRRPTLFGDLFRSERSLIEVMERLRFGRIERLRIENFEPVMQPAPVTVRAVRFGSDTAVADRTSTSKSPLKLQVVELLEYIRSVPTGEISILEFRHGVPFAMETELRTERADHSASGRGVP